MSIFYQNLVRYANKKSHLVLLGGVEVEADQVPLFLESSEDYLASVIVRVELGE